MDTGNTMLYNGEILYLNLSKAQGYEYFDEESLLNFDIKFKNDGL